MCTVRLSINNYNLSRSLQGFNMNSPGLINPVVNATIPTFNPEGVELFRRLNFFGIDLLFITIDLVSLYPNYNTRHLKLNLIALPFNFHQTKTAIAPRQMLLLPEKRNDSIAPIHYNAP